MRALKTFGLPLVQALVAVGLLIYLLGDARVRAESVTLIRQADLRWGLLGLLAGGVCELASMARWWCCLSIVGTPVSRGRAAALHFAGGFATLFLPGSAGGDALKIICLAVEYPQKRVSVVLSVLLDRLCGLVAVMAAAFCAVAFRAQWFRQAPATAGLVNGVLLFLSVTGVGLGLWYLAGHPRMRDRHPQWLPYRERFLEFAEVFERFLRGGWRAVAALLLSVVGLVSFFLVFYFAAKACGVEVALRDLMAIMPTIDVVSMLPITLNGIGLREQLFETMLGSLCHVPPAAAITVSLSGFGLFSLWSLLGSPVLALCRRSTTQ